MMSVDRRRNVILEFIESEFQLEFSLCFRAVPEQLLKNNPKAEAELKLELTLDEFENHITPPAKAYRSGSSSKN